MSDNIFRQYGTYYDLLYQDKDYEGEAVYVASTLRSISPQVQSLLEFGSGTGIHGRLLARHGFDVLGVERSEHMVAAAGNVCESNGGSFNCIQGDIRSVELSRVFDAVLALFHVVSYQAHNEDVLQMFTNAACHLRPGGVFLFDLWYGPAVLTDRPVVRVKRVEDDKTRLIRLAEPELDLNASVVTVRYTILAESKSTAQLTTFGEEHRMRYFFPAEIDLIARQTGFEVVQSEEFLTGRPPTESTWGVAYLLRKLA